MGGKLLGKQFANIIRLFPENEVFWNGKANLTVVY
jgi:hypothetical protein